MTVERSARPHWFYRCRTHSISKCGPLHHCGVLAIDLGAGCCGRGVGTAPQCLTLIDAFERLVSGSGPAADDLGLHSPSCWPPTSPLVWLGSRRAANIHPALPSNLKRRGERINTFRWTWQALIKFSTWEQLFYRDAIGVPNEILRLLGWL